MKITIICDVLGEENNGATHAVMNFIRNLKSKGHDVKIVCPDEDKKELSGYYVCPKRNFGPFNNYIKKVGVCIAKTDDKILDEAIKDADIVHIHLPFPMGWKAIKIAQKYDIPTTASFHMQAENFTCHVKLQKFNSANHLVYKFINNKTYKKVDAIHYPTEFIKNIFETQTKQKTNAYVISNGVNAQITRKETPKPEELKDKFVILSTGRYCTEKAQDILIKAAGLSKHKDKIQIIFAGQGPKLKYFEKLSKKVGISPIFKFFTRDEIIDAINYCDLYVHPARVELEGIACLEAICCGKPTVVSNSKKSATSGFAIDERCVFKNDDPADLSNKIDFFYENDDIRKEIGEKYFQSAKNYDQNECMKQMENMLYETIERHKKRNSKSKK